MKNKIIFRVNNIDRITLSYEYLDKKLNFFPKRTKVVKSLFGFRKESIEYPDRYAQNIDSEYYLTVSNNNDYPSYDHLKINEKERKVYIKSKVTLIDLDGNYSEYFFETDEDADELVSDIMSKVDPSVKYQTIINN